MTPVSALADRLNLEIARVEEVIAASPFADAKAEVPLPDLRSLAWRKAQGERGLWIVAEQATRIFQTSLETRILAVEHLHDLYEALRGASADLAQRLERAIETASRFSTDPQEG